MTARVALKNVDGVDDAEVSYEKGRAIVTFDPRVTNPETFIAELARLTDFTAEVGAGNGTVDESEGAHVHDTTHVHN